MSFTNTYADSESAVSDEQSFERSRWGEAASARGGVPNQALEDICCTYWRPFYGYIQRRGHRAHDAEDLTQEFFARLLKSRAFQRLKPEGGSLHCYLQVSLKCFLASHWRRQQCQKRGGGKLVLSFEEACEEPYHPELAEHSTPATLLDGRWALALLDRVLERLQEEYSKAAKGELFEKLRGSLPGAEIGAQFAEIGRVLQMSEGAVRMAAHRLRRRYGELLRTELEKTVSNPEEVDEEIRHLIAAAS